MLKAHSELQDGKVKKLVGKLLSYHFTELEEAVGHVNRQGQIHPLPPPLLTDSK